MGRRRFCNAATMASRQLKFCPFDIDLVNQNDGVVNNNSRKADNAERPEKRHRLTGQQKAIGNSHKYQRYADVT